MKNLIFSFIILFSIFAQSQNNSKSNNEELNLMNLRTLKEMTDKWVIAYNSKNSENLAEFYDENADYISPHVAGLILKGKKEILKNFQNGMDLGGSIIKLDINDFSFSCEIATITTTYFAKNNGENFTGKNLLVLHKVKDKWLIIKHASII